MEAKRVRVSVLACALAGILMLAASPAVRVQFHRIARTIGMERIAPPIRTGDTLRPMPLHTLDGSALALGYARGTVVYNVFTTWCPSCREELPAFAHAAPQLARHGIALVGIDQGEPAASVATYIQTLRVPYPVLLDDAHVTNALLGSNLIPTTFVVHDGIVRRIIAGPLTESDLELIAERP